jgi:hypothetical protein
VIEAGDPEDAPIALLALDHVPRRRLFSSYCSFIREFARNASVRGNAWQP